MYVLGISVKNEICVPSKEAEKFAKVFVNNGKIEKIEYVDNRDDLVGAVHFFITPKEEYVFDFLEMGAEPLMTPAPEMSINDIVEAFLFRELFSYGSI
ncbi:hypothetical protein [Caminibacter pacificus]|uniref:Uncharacterized protein n=1 Tax=Caminibacter pacificus TaxID=1424653 RepID=A0AAJ4RD17_9BACT|nr:hypothetical protein [Caminibacter pacificus]QCI27656.1 hypothetical protein C6V80_01355 [Caminibacter pacificus]ROR40169.1 hypothetical protein EDC58_1156 [Caminibacter pacificus]